MTNPSNYAEFSEESEKHLSLILNSPSQRNVVVAGPGTGKTALFKMLLREKKRALTLSFVNSLIDDLSLELYGLSDVKTLHGFARGELSRVLHKSIDIFPKIPKVIREDSLVLLNTDFDFDRIFHEMIDNKEALDFYRKRRIYYNFYGYADIIYSVLKFYEANPAQIPSFTQILVDEFQDFNKLEVSLIDSLGSISPILLAGDDDQALYDFKSASTRYIREFYSEEAPDYMSFSLPFCYRCTSVIVHSINEFIQSAEERGHLVGRITKPFQYFESELKDVDSSMYSHIAYSQIFDNRIPWYIEHMINKIALGLRKTFNVLIITPYRSQAQKIVKSLNSKGFQNVEYDQREDPELTIWDGLNLLMNDFASNLGWRILSRFLFEPEEFNSLLRQTLEEPARPYPEMLQMDFVRKIRKIIKTLKLISEEKSVDDDSLNELIELTHFEQKTSLLNAINKQIKANHASVFPAIKKIPIRVTTIQSSKGLTGDFVFITHFDDQYYISTKDKTMITDREICNFLVALSRARKQVFLVSSRTQDPEFLNWLPTSNIDRIKI